MARSVTVSTIMDSVRERVDDEGAVLADDTELIRYIDRAWTRLYAKYAAAEPDRFRTTATLSLSGNTAALPSDWLATIGVDYQENSSTFYPLRRLHEAERHTFNGQATGSRALAYRVIGSNIVLYPTPPAGQTYVLIYLPTATALTASGDTIDCRNGHDEYLSMLVARRLLKQEQAYEGDFEDEIGRIESELMEEAHMRYLNEPELMFGLTRLRGYAADEVDPAEYRWKYGL